MTDVMMDSKSVHESVNHPPGSDDRTVSPALYGPRSQIATEVLQ